MDFSPTEAQCELAMLTRRIVTDQVDVERLRAAEAAGARHDRALWATLAETGILGTDDLLEQCTVLVELGRALAPVPYLPTVAVAGPAVARFGSAETRLRWLAPAVAGQAVLTFALSAPDAGRPHAAADGGDGWRISGEVPAVPAGPVADAILVETDGGVFLVEPGDAGVDIQRQPTTDHDDAALLVLDQVPLPDERRLAGPNGADVAGWLRSRAAVARCAYQLGVLEQGLEMTAEHARTRIQFGRPIGAFQAVSQRLANAYVDVRAVELALWNAACALADADVDASAGAAGQDEGAGPDGDWDWADDPGAAAATAKFWAAEAGHRVAHTLVHVHGGTGIDLEHPAHRYFLAAKRTEFDGGGATAQLRALGALLATG